MDCLVRRKRLSAHGSSPLDCLVRRKRLAAHGSPPAGQPGIIIGRLLDLTLVLLLTALRKETLQLPDFVNLFRGEGFSYASRLEAIFDLFAIDLHSGRPSKAPHT